jgi:MFS family permease
VRLRLSGPLWANGDFLRLWAGQTISAFGTEITELALPLAAVLVLEASAFEVAGLAVAITLPWLFLSLPAGAWVDRLRRRPILIVTDWGRGLALASVPIAYAFDVLTLAQLYAVALVTGMLTVFFDVAYQSYLPSLVAREELTDANGKLEATRTGAQTAGPTVAGVLVSLLTAPYAVVVDSLSFVASALFVTSIRRREEPRLQDHARTRLRTEIGEGLSFTFRHPILRWSLVYVATINFFTSALFSIYIVFAVRTLGLSAATIGVIGSLASIGPLAGALAAPRLSARFGVGPALVGSAAVGGWSLLLLPLARGDYVIPLLVLGSLGFGFCALVYNVAGISLMQAITPDRMLGRMTASRRFVVFGINPLGALAGGALGTGLGLRETMWIAALGASVAFVALLPSPIPRVRTVADAENLVGTPAV